MKLTDRPGLVHQNRCVNGPHDDTRSTLASGERALFHHGDLQASRRRFDAAHAAAQRDGDQEAAALAALGMGGLWVHEHRTIAGAAAGTGSPSGGAPGRPGTGNTTSCATAMPTMATDTIS